ncbi:DNA-invertase hin [Gammaproteobacteria bacterium]|nr:DNA-invertase hin [Gammaproteobacteria bacterium]
MTTPTLRAAIYCRKSSEEGLEQDFNSLDAQREACEAYIASQRHQGWRLIATPFDDWGYSGGTLERPALQQLLSQIKDRRVDVIVVYKVDRLTRSLADFAKLVEVFDAQGVSFVSVTQQFNTTSSMGRLTLNVLLSFAQFEREVTGERIRDKIAASKRKGMWMGGKVPLGYRVEDRRLMICEAEAVTVRRLFALYLQHGCMRALQAAALQEGLTTRTGQGFFRGNLYHLLQNPLYRGQVRHRQAVYPGQHAAIIDEGLWAAVQARLAENRIDRNEQRGAKDPSLLAGRLYGAAGEPFTPSHAVKNGKRYRYYIQRHDTPASPHRRRRRQRLPAAEIETLVKAAILRLLRSQPDVWSAVCLQEPSTEAAQQLRERAAALADGLANGADQHGALRALLHRVQIGTDAVKVELQVNALRLAFDLPPLVQKDAPIHILTIPAQLRRRGVETKFVIEGPASARTPQPDPSLIKTIVRAHEWWHRWRTGQGETLASIAKSEGVKDRYVARVIALAFLAPDLTTQILDGQHSPALSTDALLKYWLLPPAWPDQRRLLG